LQSERGRQNQEQDQGVWLAGEEDRSEMRFAVYTPILATRRQIESIRRLDTGLLPILSPALFMKNSLIDPFKRMIRLFAY